MGITWRVIYYISFCLYGRSVYSKCKLTVITFSSKGVFQFSSGKYEGPDYIYDNEACKPWDRFDKIAVNVILHYFKNSKTKTVHGFKQHDECNFIHF